jgi:hypothetical protein
MNKKQLFADFYMYEFLCTYKSLSDSPDDLDLKYGAIIFLEKFRDELAEILEYVIIAEASHIWWETNLVQRNAVQFLQRMLSDEAWNVMVDFQSPFYINLSPLALE